MSFDAGFLVLTDEGEGLLEKRSSSELSEPNRETGARAAGLRAANGNNGIKQAHNRRER